MHERHADLERLVALAPPPAVPTAADGDFGIVESELATPPPSDWKQVVARYGYGSFCEFLHLWSPFFAPCPMVVQSRRALAGDRQLAARHPTAVPFPLHPAPGGAFPWANTDNGDVIYWLTGGAPDDWPVAVWNPRGKHEVIEGGAARFLVRLLAREATSNVFGALVRGDEELGMPPCFDAWRERAHLVFDLFEMIEPPDDRVETAFLWRLRALSRALAPAMPRGASGGIDDEERQAHFRAGGGAWFVTYDCIYGHNLRLTAPAGELAIARAAIERAITVIGCRVTGVRER